ncbi:MAG: Hpt domain-containing protein [Clostridia bacterium]|nr:Hpt domain-containing protein [Clostridia bacterium]
MTETLDKLKALGCNVEEGLKRCLDKETFYLRLLKTAMTDDKVYALKQALVDNDLGEAFSIAHSLKGVFANLSITPLFDSVSVLVDCLRKRESADYIGMIDNIIRSFESIKDVILS